MSTSSGSRYAVDEVGNCEFAVAVLNQWQARGVAGALSKYLFVYARQHGIETVYAIMFATNHLMIKLAQGLGMSLHVDPQDPTLMRATRALASRTARRGKGTIEYK